MQYEPIKRSLGRFFTKSLFLRKVLYFLLDLLLLRTWHVRKALKKLDRFSPMIHQFLMPDQVSDSIPGE